MKDLKNTSILIVEDEESLRKAIVFDFKRKGFNVFDAENGTLALDIVKNNKIDVVLTDVRMPNGDGIELLDKIRDFNVELPIVMFVTGFADISVEDAYNKGVNAIFSKPFDRKNLLETVLRSVKDKNDRWSDKVQTEVSAENSIELNLTELNQAITGKVISFGSGGMFVATENDTILEGTKVSFSIKFKSGIPNSIEGRGTIKWVRIQSKPEEKAGCGIEFDYLEDGCREKIIELIKTKKTKAYIPKV